MLQRLLAIGGAAVLVAASPAEARNIVISNDDGLTANVKALYDALKAEGHDVIVVVPCQQQSGMGAALSFVRPLRPLTADCVNGAARAGDPGAGPMTRAGLGGDFHYVDGTPVMALLYGLDIVAPARWGKAPDLVLSGPNIGQNAGSIVISSGTVSNAQYAMIRGIPAIALSAGENTGSGPDLANPRSLVVARQSVELVGELDRTSGGKPLLPPGTGLNVNFPDQPERAQWKLTRIGSYTRYELRFVPDLAAATGRKMPEGTPPMPGLTIGMSTAAPRADQRNDEAWVVQSAITVSVMQIGYDAPAGTEKRLGKRLGKLTGR